MNTLNLNSCGNSKNPLNNKYIKDMKTTVGEETKTLWQNPTQTNTQESYTKSLGNVLSDAELNSFGGKSMKWNQFVTPRNASSSGITISVNTGVFTISGTASSNNYVQISSTPVDFVYGHKYAVLGISKVASSTQGYIRLHHAGRLADIAVDGIYQCLDTTHTSLSCPTYLYFQTGTIITQVETTIDVIDLTLIFGTGNEPTEITDSRIQWIKQYALEHPTYDSGSIIHALVESVDSVGVNIWDEEWELGDINDDGTLRPIANRYRSKNYVPIDANKTYRCVKKAGEAIQVSYYTFNKTYMHRETNTSQSNFALTIPSNAYYLKFANIATGTYNHDIQICLDSLPTSVKTTYHPYNAHTFPIPTEVQNLDGYGWSAGSVYNEVDLVNMKFIKRVGKVDLGSAPWRIDNNNRASFAIDGIKQTTNNYDIGNLLSENYIVTNWASTSSATSDGVMAQAPNTNTVAFYKQGAFGGKTQAQVQEMFTGKTLYYELATPIETDISSYFTNNLLEVESNGTVTFSNDNKMSVPSSLKTFTRY